MMRGFTRAFARRGAARLGYRALANANSKMMREALDEGLGLIEVAQIAADIAEIIEGAQQAAAGAAVDVFVSALSAGMNKGQQALIQDHCMDAANEYFENVTVPEPSEYFDAIYSQHEAIADCLSATVEQSWGAASSAALQVLYDTVGQIIGEALLEKILDNVEGRKRTDSKHRSSGWSGLDFDLRRSMADWGDYSWIPASVKKSGQWRPIKDPKYFLLPKHPEAPFWIKENARGMHLYMTGRWSTEYYTEWKKNLFAQTSSDPNSPNAPPTYSEYKGEGSNLKPPVPFNNGDYWTRYDDPAFQAAQDALFD